jgi:hypothetical protein
MEIEPSEKPSKFQLRNYAQVKFESFDELWDFAHAAPVLSKEKHRALSHFTYGMWPGPKFPESFPFNSKVPESVLARTAGRLMLEAAAPHEMHMLERISDYFLDRRAQRMVPQISGEEIELNGI